MMLPVNRAVVLIPISSTRREQLIARGMYIPFRDDADPELQSDSRQSARQVAKIDVPRVSKLATQQRVREPEPIRNRFTHPPQMLEIFASILTEESLLNRLGIDGCFKCEWKGCGAEMASEALLQRHIKARNHAAQGAFDLGGLTIYECHWRVCERPSFKTAAKLVQHIVAEHVSERLVCPYGECNWRSSSISHLYWHVSRTHDDDGEEPRVRVDELHAPELSELEALPPHVNTDVLTTLRATGTSCRTQRHQEHAHDKVIRMCIAPENPDITISHPPHMLVVLDEEESLVTTREPSEGTDGVVGDDGNQDMEGESDEPMDVDDEGSPELDHMILFEDIVIDNDDSNALDYNNNSFGDDTTPVPEASVGTLAVKASSQPTRCKRKRNSASSTPRAAKRVMARRTGTRQITVSNGNAEVGPSTARRASARNTSAGPSTRTPQTPNRVMARRTGGRVRASADNEQATESPTVNGLRSSQRVLAQHVGAVSPILVKWEKATPPASPTQSSKRQMAQRTGPVVDAFDVEGEDESTPNANGKSKGKANTSTGKSRGKDKARAPPLPLMADTPSPSTLSGRVLGGKVEPGTGQYIDSIQVPKIDTSAYTRLYLEYGPSS